MTLCRRDHRARSGTLRPSPLCRARAVGAQSQSGIAGFGSVDPVAGGMGAAERARGRGGRAGLYFYRSVGEGGGGEASRIRGGKGTGIGRGGRGGATLPVGPKKGEKPVADVGLKHRRIGRIVDHCPISNFFKMEIKLASAGAVSLKWTGVSIRIESASIPWVGGAVVAELWRGRGAPGAYFFFLETIISSAAALALRLAYSGPAGWSLGKGESGGDPRNPSKRCNRGAGALKVVRCVPGAEAVASEGPWRSRTQIAHLTYSCPSLTAVIPPTESLNEGGVVGAHRGTMRRLREKVTLVTTLLCSSRTGAPLPGRPKGK